MTETSWFSDLLNASGESHAYPYLMELAGSSLVALDDAAMADLVAFMGVHAPAMKMPSNIVLQRHAHIELARQLEIKQIVVVDSADEEAAIRRIHDTLVETQFPAAIINTTRILGFCADVIPATMTRRPAGQIEFSSTPAFEDLTLFAIVSTPRAGSTLLAELLESIGLGHPVEHLRPWVINFFAKRPKGLFDAIRFAQRLIGFDSRGRFFGTKAISHLAEDFWKTLEPEEKSYVRQLTAKSTTIYLNRRNKLDQTISNLKAKKTNIWHSTDQAYGGLGSQTIDYSFDDIRNTLTYFLREEEKVVTALGGRDGVITVDYDELSATPGSIARQVGERLGVAVTSEPQAKVTKLADDMSASLAGRFLGEASSRGIDVTPNFDAHTMLAAERERRAEEIRQQDELAEKIRNGHAASRAGSYQDRHYYLMDYQAFEVPGLTGKWRGPKPSSLEPGSYVLFLGAAQTYGAFVADPFPAQIGRRLGVDTLNLAFGGVSPLFYSQNPAMRRMIVGARAVVVQAMAARMVPNARMGAHGNMNMMYFLDDPERKILDANDIWEKVRKEETAERVLELVTESRAKWSAAMREIAELCKGPSIMLWMSDREPDYKPDLKDLFGLFSRYPQLVDRTAVETARPSFTEYVEVAMPRGESVPTVSEFSGVLLPVVFGGHSRDDQQLQTVDHYYPTARQHDAVAAALEPVMRRVLGIPG